MASRVTSNFQRGDGRNLPSIDSDIVDVIICKRFFDTEDGEERLERATRLFTRPAGGEEGDC